MNKRCAPALVALVAALAACGGGDDKPKKKSSDDKPSTTATATATPAPTATSAPPASASGAASGAPSAMATGAPVACPPLGQIPEIPASETPPPTVGEWLNACPVNNGGPNTHPDDCTMKVVREWVQISCRGPVTGYEMIEGLSAPNSRNVFEFHGGDVESILFRFKKGMYPKGRLCRSTKSAVFFLSWPQNEAKPKFMSLGKRDECESPSFTW
jgi:hypothetical protein